MSTSKDDPSESDTDREDKAKEDEIRGMQVNQEGDNIYLGMSVQCLDQAKSCPSPGPDDATHSGIRGFPVPSLK